MREPDYRAPPLNDSGASTLDPVITYDLNGLTVIRTDGADFGTVDERGFYDYFYAFAMYEVRVGSRRLRARRYADEWQRVSIFPGEDQRWEGVPYDDAAFCSAARYFFALDDVEEVTAFTSEYRAVDEALLSMESKQA